MKARDWNAPGNLVEYVTRLNRIRREHRALQLYSNLTFHRADNPHVLWYSKATPAGDDVVFVAVNLNPHAIEDSLVDVPLAALGLAADESYRMHEVLTDVLYDWRGPRGYVKLDPQAEPAQIFALRR